jgi:hypothetical protein
MTIAPQGLFQEWRVADRNARAIEHALSRASLSALDGKAEPPSAEERERAKKLRETADDLFQLAMADMQLRAKNRRR